MFVVRRDSYDFERRLSFTEWLLDGARLLG
jgi:hypothetical protein